jgi:hypothetical protein
LGVRRLSVRRAAVAAVAARLPGRRGAASAAAMKTVAPLLFALLPLAVMTHVVIAC